MQEARRLYNAVAVPKISYASDLWFHTKRPNATKIPTQTKAQ
jgi:hypothetical protein